jgi:SRSO17 transposase
LYLPKEWAGDVGRRAEAGVPEEVEFATKPQLARAMIGRALEAGVPFKWVTGDEMYGNDRKLRVWMEGRELFHVLAVASNQYVWLGFRQAQVRTVAAQIPEAAWQRASAGEGGEGAAPR